MNQVSTSVTEIDLPLQRAFFYSFIAIISFHLAYAYNFLSFLIVVYLFCLIHLGRLSSPRMAFYVGLFTGFCCAFEASFFWNIFGAAAIALWVILAFWTALFVTLSQLCRAKFGKSFALLLIPCLWTGLEYFRSELYYLRFSWINVGYVFEWRPGSLPPASLSWYVRHRFCPRSHRLSLGNAPSPSDLASPQLLSDFRSARSTATNLPSPKENFPVASSRRNVRIAGAQLEFPSEPQVVRALDDLQKDCPDADLLVLSEYTFTAPIPESVRNWCLKNHRYLIVGGENSRSKRDNIATPHLSSGQTARLSFRQAKSVPIQFFKDQAPRRISRALGITLGQNWHLHLLRPQLHARH